MKRLIFITLISTVMLSCNEDFPIGNNNCLKGSGETITETLDVAYFNAVRASVVGNVILSQGSKQEVKVITHPNVLVELRASIANDELVLDFERCVSDIEKLDIFITMPDIKSIVLAGVGNLSTPEMIASDDLTVILSGVGNLNLSGEADKFDCSLTGVGDLKAFDLVTNDSKVVVSGIGNAEITVQNQLEAVITGAGNIHYKGSPEITSTVTGVGNLINSN